jgi:hypothetical protein
LCVSQSHVSRWWRLLGFLCGSIVRCLTFSPDSPKRNFKNGVFSRPQPQTDRSIDASAFATQAIMHHPTTQPFLFVVVCLRSNQGNMPHPVRQHAKTSYKHSIERKKLCQKG